MLLFAMYQLCAEGPSLYAMKASQMDGVLSFSSDYRLAAEPAAMRTCTIAALLTGSHRRAGQRRHQILCAPIALLAVSRGI
jgi:hypothetical protein